jgi:predicted HTH domain antitoxin
MHIELQPEVSDILQPLGHQAAEFFLAASLYHARKISFMTAAQLAGLDFESFKTRLIEHFGQGYIMDDESVLEDLEDANTLQERANGNFIEVSLDEL